MNDIKKGDIVQIQCYKHDGKIYRSWDKAIVIDISDNFLICGNNKTKVTEVDGREWNTKEPAILFFYKTKWFNIIAQFKDKGIFYYCNIATPYVIENKTIKYIDYDIDLRIFPDKTFRVLDKAEYEYHKNKMNYPEDIDKIVKFELNNLIEMYKEQVGPFSKEFLNKYYNLYVNNVKMSN